MAIIDVENGKCIFEEGYVPKGWHQRNALLRLYGHYCDVILKALVASTGYVKNVMIQAFISYFWHVGRILRSYCSDLRCVKVACAAYLLSMNVITTYYIEVVQGLFSEIEEDEITPFFETPEWKKVLDVTEAIKLPVLAEAASRYMNTPFGSYDSFKDAVRDINFMEQVHSIFDKISSIERLLFLQYGQERTRTLEMLWRLFDEVAELQDMCRITEGIPYLERVILYVITCYMYNLTGHNKKGRVVPSRLPKHTRKASRSWCC